MDRSPYPLVKQVVQHVQNGLYQRTIAGGFFGSISRKEAVPTRLINSSSNLATLPLHGICTRSVGTESLRAVLALILDVGRPLIKETLPSKVRSSALAQVDCLDEIVSQYRQYFYRNAPTMLFNIGQVDDILKSIPKLKWNRNQFNTEPNKYVRLIVALFNVIDGKITSANRNFPPQIHHQLNCECLTYLQEKMVAQYARIKKCTTEGRTQMSLDQSELRKALEKLRNMTPLANWDYVAKFVSAYYLDQKQLLEFVMHHPEYSQDIHESIANTGRAQVDMKKKERKRFVEKVRDICKNR